MSDKNDKISAAIKTSARRAMSDGIRRAGFTAVYDDYRKCIDEIKPDAIVIATGWDMHLPVTKYAMEKGVAVALEVGGAYSIESLWELVRLYERTKTPIMMMEIFATAGRNCSLSI